MELSIHLGGEEASVMFDLWAWMGDDQASAQPSHALIPMDATSQKFDYLFQR
jgi:hypothetical protein